MVSSNAMGLGANERMMEAPCWVGVDVGGRPKGFHLAILAFDRFVHFAHLQNVEHCVEAIRRAGPVLVAIDSPAAWAPDGEMSRPCERQFARSGVCGIIFTPDAANASRRTDRYFEWIENGLDLWVRLHAEKVEVTECFPTASWTAWLGPRRQQTRASWTTKGIQALASQGIRGVDAASNQDERDAVAAAVTARQATCHPKSIERFGGLIVPKEGTLATNAIA